MHQIAFIVNTYHRSPDTLFDCISSIKAQREPNTIIVIIDQNERNQYFQIEDVVIYHFPNKSISTARNYAYRNIDAQWYLFIDDDGILIKNSTQSFLEIIRNKNVIPDIIGGKVHIKGSSMAYSIRQNLKEGSLNLMNLKAVMGGLIAIKKECLYELGGFDERLGIGSIWGSGEESDFVFRAYARKKTILFSSRFAIDHPAPTDMSIEKVKSYALGKGAVLKKLLKDELNLLFVFEFLDTFCLPMFRTFFYLLILKKHKCQNELIKLSFRWKGFVNFK
jgi:glycosyltransferase involved in cell wall biosynthesis